MRYRGISAGYQTAAILLAGFTPVIAKTLVLWSGGTWPPRVAIIMVTTLIAVAAVAEAKKSKSPGLDAIGKPLPARALACSAAGEK